MASVQINIAWPKSIGGVWEKYKLTKKPIARQNEFFGKDGT